MKKRLNANFTWNYKYIWLVYNMYTSFYATKFASSGLL